jgi:hypothetical protein
MLNPELVVLEFDSVVRGVPVIVENEALIGALACREEVHKGLKIGIVQEIMLNSEGRLIEGGVKESRLAVEVRDT